MNVWEENYGADADGNRGVPTIMYELDGSDAERENIIEKLVTIFEADGELDLSGEVSVCITDDSGEGDFDFNVCPGEYMYEVLAAIKEDDDESDVEHTKDVCLFEIEILKLMLEESKRPKANKISDKNNKWVDVTASRYSGIIYTNPKSTPLYIFIKNKDNTGKSIVFGECVSQINKCTYRVKGKGCYRFTNIGDCGGEERAGKFAGSAYIYECHADKIKGGK